MGKFIVQWGGALEEEEASSLEDLIDDLAACFGYMSTECGEKEVITINPGTPAAVELKMERRITRHVFATVAAEGKATEYKELEL